MSPTQGLERPQVWEEFAWSLALPFYFKLLLFIRTMVLLWARSTERLSIQHMTVGVFLGMKPLTMDKFLGP